MYRRRSEGVEEEGVFLVGGLAGWRLVRWLMVARIVVSWWIRWSGTGGGAGGVDWRVEERW